MKVLKLLCKLLWLPVVFGILVTAMAFAPTTVGAVGVLLMFVASLLAWGGYVIADIEGWFE